jgi:transposase InsO family protein
MRIHANARTCPNSRRLLVRRVEEEGWGLIPAAEAAGISQRSARKWLSRWRAEGEAGLLDRSSAPRRRPTRMPADRLEAIEALRRLRMTAAEIAEVLGMALSTVSRWLRRIGLGRRGALAPPEPPNRYERKRPGELIHVDVKKLGRISVRGAGHRVTGDRRGQVKVTVDGASRRVTGWEFVHVCVDDATRLAYVEVLADERGHTAAQFLRRAALWFGRHGVRIKQVMTDNGSGYLSFDFRYALLQLRARHIRTRPYRPRTNGKAERFIQTMLREWAYAVPYGHSAQRTTVLAHWLCYYNHDRPHGALNDRAPMDKLKTIQVNNLVRLDS